MRARLIVLVAGGLLAAVGLAEAQGRPGRQFGPVVGLNLFTFTGTDAGETKTRTTFHLGIALNMPLGAHSFVQPELLYAGKGANFSMTDSLLGNIEGGLRLTYLELPVLFGFNIPTTGSTRPRIYAGPYLALNLDCDAFFSVAGFGGAVDCGSAGTSVRSTEVGGTIGGGISFTSSGFTFTLDARYSRAFTALIDSSDTRNTGLSISAGMMFPLGR